ncbi:MAG: baseplate J/gp47 family protein [Lachnospiraceae bacterium]|nr:baseplate J/gp47 family protein [Lachnospiraceae bacterium]
MLQYIANEGKTYEERYAEALTTIPLYTDEWTDFNPADPGITILENLIGFETLQQEHILDASPEVKRRLLEMVGFTRERGKRARLLLAADKVVSPVTLPANHRFRIGEMYFETDRQVEVDDRRLIGIYGKRASDEEFLFYDQLLDRETKVPVAVFGEKPVAGDELYLVSNNLPSEGTETVFYFTLRERYNRNRMLAHTENTFASVRWECYTSGGWVEMKVRDATNAFLTSGEIRMWIPADAAVYNETPTKGYCIRAILERAEYDVRPRVTAIESFLFEVWQKHTISENMSFGKSTELEVVSGMEEDVYVNVFVREAKGESYRVYDYSPDPQRQGRFYDRIDHATGRMTIRFDKAVRGFGPERGRDCVRVVLYTEDVMRQYRIGKVLGYDKQRLNLPYVRIVPHNFSIIARRITDSGEELFDFVRPEKNEEGSLYYHLYEGDGEIEIEDAGDFIGADLFLAGVAVHEGADGNIRAGNHLDSIGEITGNTYYNPGEGTGGAFGETLEDVRRRFLVDMETAYTAVTTKDYESIVMNTPGLCIHKAHARMDETKNLVSIAVKPGTDEEFPRLPELYQTIIMKRLEQRRLLTSRIELVQPVYTEVNVKGTVYVKHHYENCAEEIEETVRAHIDYLNSDKNFGDRLHFDEVFHAIEMLDCVEFVYDLSIRPKSMAVAKMEDADILPAYNCLLYPGHINIETVTSTD